MYQLMEQNQHEKGVKIILRIFSTILIPLAIALFGYWFSNAIRESEVRQKYIEIAVGILSEASTQDDQGLRTWAVEVINQYSDIKLANSLVQKLSNGMAVFPTSANAAAPSAVFEPNQTDLLTEEIALKKLDKELCDAQNYLKGRSLDAQVKACEIYRNVLGRLSPASRKQLDQGMLNEAQKDYRNTNYEDAAIKFKVLFLNVRTCD
jgi:hypothetical protein